METNFWKISDYVYFLTGLLISVLFRPCDVFTKTAKIWRREDRSSIKLVKTHRRTWGQYKQNLFNSIFCERDLAIAQGENIFHRRLLFKKTIIMKIHLAYFLTLLTVARCAQGSEDVRNEIFKDCTRELYDRVVRFEYLYYEGYWLYPYNKLRNHGPSFHYTEKDFCKNPFYIFNPFYQSTSTGT